MQVTVDAPHQGFRGPQLPLEQGHILTTLHRVNVPENVHLHRFVDVDLLGQPFALLLAQQRPGRMHEIGLGVHPGAQVAIEVLAPPEIGDVVVAEPGHHVHPDLQHASQRRHLPVVDDLQEFSHEAGIGLEGADRLLHVGQPQQGRPAVRAPDQEDRPALLGLPLGVQGVLPPAIQRSAGERLEQVAHAGQILGFLDQEFHAARGVDVFQQPDPIDQIGDGSPGVAVDLVPGVEVRGFFDDLPQRAGGRQILLAQQDLAIPFLAPGAHPHIRVEGWVRQPNLGHGVHAERQQRVGALELVPPGRDLRIVLHVAGVHLQMQRHVVDRLMRTGGQDALPG